MSRYFGCFAIALALTILASANTSYAATAEYSPSAQRHFPDRVFWGDTHLHTPLSTDANAQGNKNLSPADAYTVARGGAVTAHNGMQVKLQRPLDFLVIADHAENLGVANSVQRRDPALQNTSVGARLIDAFERLGAATPEALRDFVYSLGNEDALVHDEHFRQTIWQRVSQTADQYNEPGVFSAFIGYEWTSRYENGARHRVVVFKDSGEETNQILPFSARDSANPEDLWRFLARYEALTGGEVISIAHNPNLSNGREFALTDLAGQPFSLAHQKLRQRWEPLLEITQIKGDSETLSILSPNDEFADYETWEGWSVIHGQGIGQSKTVLDLDVNRAQYEYARSALKLGLQQHAIVGVNPYKFGFIGSTDAHTSLPAVREENFWGKHAIVEPSPERLTHPRYRWRMGASGYAAVWAQENTREAIFAAMKRKETYATTGPRIGVRFFGGWEFEAEDATLPRLAEIGYAKGVPMGGDLPKTTTRAPSFLIHVSKDPDGANLDRVQVIKGWRDERGKLHEQVYDVVLSDGRKITKNGKSNSVGSTVDVGKATYTNTIGAVELATVWRDPDFNADDLAFYYLRVLEIPTPRWPAYDARFFGLSNPPAEAPMVTQERAYTSPIWYTPTE